MCALGEGCFGGALQPHGATARAGEADALHLVVPEPSLPHSGLLSMQI